MGKSLGRLDSLSFVLHMLVELQYVGGAPAYTKENSKKILIKLPATI